MNCNVGILDKKTNKMNTQIAQLTKKRRLRSIKSQMKGDRRTDTIDVQRTIRKYYTQRHDNKFGNPIECNACLDICSLPKLNHERIGNLNSINSKDHPNKEIPECSGFSAELY